MLCWQARSSHFIPVPSLILVNHLNWPISSSFSPINSILASLLCNLHHFSNLYPLRARMDWLCTHTTHTSSFSFELCNNFTIDYNCSSFGSYDICHIYTSIYTKASILMVFKVKAWKEVNSIVNWSVWKSPSIITHIEKEPWWRWY